MSFRVGGGLALVAAIALVLALVSSAWWAGHPVVDGNEQAMRDVSVGLAGAEGCNTGGDGQCFKVALGGGFKTIAAIELGACGVSALLGVALALAAVLERRAHKAIGRAAIAFGGAAVVLALALLAIGPDLAKATAGTHIPIGYAAFLAILGGAGIAFGGVVADRVAGASADVAVSAGAGAARGSAPLLARASEPVAASRESAAVIGSGPQLRPLYDLPGHGGMPQSIVPRMPAQQLPIVDGSRNYNGHVHDRQTQPQQPPPALAAPSTIQIAMPPMPVAASARETMIPTPASALATVIPPPPTSAPSKSPARPPRPPGLTLLGTAPTELAATSLSPPSTTPTGTGSGDSEVATSVQLTSPHERAATEPSTAPSDTDSHTAVTDVPDPPDAIADAASVLSSEFTTVSHQPDTAVTEALPPSSAPATDPAQTALASNASPACPQCEAPMGWSDQHLRFYCKSCKMYF